MTAMSRPIQHPKAFNETENGQLYYDQRFGTDSVCMQRNCNANANERRALQMVRNGCIEIGRLYTPASVV